MLCQTQKYKKYDEVNMAIANETNKEIQQICSDINDISEMMNDLALLVANDKEKLDIFVENVETTAENVKSGVNELEEAKKIQPGLFPSLNFLKFFDLFKFFES